MSSTTVPASADATGTPPARSRPVTMRDPRYVDVLEHYYREARLLDGDRFTEWLDLLAADLTYRMPIRVTRHRGDGPEFAEGTGHFYDNRASMVIRVRRLLETDAAYAEDPPSRVRRFVTNLHVEERGDGLLQATSYLLVLRNRFDDPQHELLSAERDDLLRSEGDGFRLVSRRVLVDQSTLGSSNLAIFL
jgi:3-phenylpropionate/cinnamic acid dioxygenase small subunit